MEEGFYAYRRLQDYNVAGRELRAKRRLLVYGTCIRDEYPEIFSAWARGRVPLAVCMEAEHFNMVGLKLASIICRVDLEEVIVLTVDGSPHCVQLHHVLEEVKKIIGGNKSMIRHFVVEKNRVVEVDPITIKTARYLSRVKKLIDRGKPPV